MPPSKKYYKYSANARNQVESYYNQYYSDASFDKVFLSYIKKSIILKYLDYYAFRKAIPNSSSIIVNSPYYFSDIYESRKPKVRASSLYKLFLGYIKLFSLFFSSLFISLISYNKVKLPQVVYIRKKAYHDLGIGELIGKEISNNGISYLKIIKGFIYKSPLTGFLCLNRLKGSVFRTIKSFIQTIYLSIVDLKYFLFSNIPFNYFQSFLVDTYFAYNFLNINSKIYTGNLLDKPFYVLLNRYKKEQLLCSINESFFYPPFISFDYNYLDVYYAMNSIDKNTINYNGGNIKEYKYVEFFRKNLLTSSNRISDDLQSKIPLFSKTILITTIQSPHNLYTQWSPNDLCAFILKIFELSKKMDNYLFIIKEKKGELRYLSKKMKDSLFIQNNILVIDSSVPRLLKENQFEDIISISDLLISMSHTSTTIWQFLSNNKPAIAVNENHPNSFLKKYDNFEVCLDELDIAVTYWLTLDNSKWNKLQNEISINVNIGEGKGLNQVGSDILDRINKY
ncbi:MAG: hypothetical protein CMG57_09745 [Candidatus Marinimicrobia bacterium]|nr:hypothetical protein [Candidatus Neomarinimicrobiota bacterium]|tara:strand:+ start:11264 stop:12790 length:1527 start_codon:yes stop_codon:yes gene_type:complete